MRGTLSTEAQTQRNMRAIWSRIPSTMGLSLGFHSPTLLTSFHRDPHLLWAPAKDQPIVSSRSLRCLPLHPPHTTALTQDVSPDISQIHPPFKALQGPTALSETPVASPQPWEHCLAPPVTCTTVSWCCMHLYPSWLSPEGANHILPVSGVPPASCTQPAE